MRIPDEENLSIRPSTKVQESSRVDLVAELDSVAKHTAPSTLEELINRNMELNQQAEELRRSLQEMEQRCMQSKASIERHIQDCGISQKNAARWIAEYHKEQERSMRLNDQQAIEMESLKALLDTSDIVDSTTVATHLSRLNNLIEQLAITLSSRWDAPQHKSVPDIHDDDLARLNSALGHRLVSTLTRCNVHDDGAPSLLQHAFQVVLASSTYSLFHVQTVSFGGDDIMQRLSNRIRNDEIQPLYGRWRSLARRHLRSIDGEDSRLEALSYFAQEATVDIHYTTLLFGISHSEEAYRVLKADLEPFLNEIGDETIKLATIVNENVISQDYRLYKPHYGPFDPNLMNRPFAPSHPLVEGEETDEVLGTILLGMGSLGKPGRQNVEAQGIIFRKAVVITDSTLRAIIGEVVSDKVPMSEF